jgi:alkanesulfonate monooxygenase SsuD/methylene tetrahydromethanopterin reductase-like flavin-dependent oxidoreductase (luciferase family)
MGMSRFIVIADSNEEAVEVARRGYARWYHSFFLLWAKHGTRPVNAAYPDNFDDMARSGLGIAGTPETVRDALIAQMAEARVNYQICRFAFGDLTFDESMRSLDLFTRSVMPALQGSGIRGQGSESAGQEPGTRTTSVARHVMTGTDL